MPTALTVLSLGVLIGWLDLKNTEVQAAAGGLLWSGLAVGFTGRGGVDAARPTQKGECRMMALDRRTFTGLTVRVTKEIRAPREVVFDAWTSAESRRRWWATGRPEGLHVCEIDARVGGRYCMKQIGSPDTPTGMDPNYEWVMDGEFVEVRRPQRLVFTWNVNHIPPERDGLVTVDFEEMPGGTRVTLTHENLPTQKSRDDTDGGWKHMLAELARVVERSGE